MITPLAEECAAGQTHKSLAGHHENTFPFIWTKDPHRLEGGGFGSLRGLRAEAHRLKAGGALAGATSLVIALTGPQT